MVDYGMFAHEIDLMNLVGAEKDFLSSFLNFKKKLKSHNQIVLVVAMSL
jgi:hypothetical protein